MFWMSISRRFLSFRFYLLVLLVIVWVIFIKQTYKRYSYYEQRSRGGMPNDGREISMLAMDKVMVDYPDQDYIKNDWKLQDADGVDPDRDKSDSDDGVDNVEDDVAAVDQKQDSNGDPIDLHVEDDNSKNSNEFIPIPHDDPNKDVIDIDANEDGADVNIDTNVPEDVNENANVPEDVNKDANIPEDVNKNANVPEDVNEDANVPGDVNKDANIPEDVNKDVKIPADEDNDGVNNNADISLPVVKNDIDTNPTIPAVVDTKEKPTLKLRGDLPPQPMPNEPDFDVVRKILSFGSAGHGGEAFRFPIQKLPQSERTKYRRAYDMNAFNEYVSNLIGVRRHLRDIRYDGCAYRYNPDGLPQTSIIICFVNEAWSTLLRTVNSVTDYSPDHLVKEIILVDDGSTWDFLGKPLEVYMSRYPKVKIVRTGSGLGLMQARMLGYQYTTAPTITFLDSHCECFPGWLEPLLTPINKDPKVVTMPIIDIINKDDFEIKPIRAPFIGIVEFPSLGFNWRVQPPREVLRLNNSIYEPVRSPAMAGGLFTISREYFELLGGFDPGMKVWGGENIEMSFKIWMCGGRIESPPCSHVGHIFHGHTSYVNLRSDSAKAMAGNNARVARVWMDAEYLQYIHSYKDGEKTIGDVSDRLAIRERIGCKSFKWYIENVYPEVFFKDDGIYSGEVRNMGKPNLCLDMGAVDNSNKVNAFPCHGHKGNQHFDMTDLGEIICHNKALQHKEQQYDVTKTTQQWTPDTLSWKYQNKMIRSPENLCISINRFNKLVMETCKGTPTQQWTWKYNRPPRKNVIRRDEMNIR